MFRLCIENGQVFTSSQLANLFEVKSLKVSRFLKEKNTLVTITDYSKTHYPDKWIGDTFHYTGGQKITGTTNAKLADSRTNGIVVHLFQVMNPDEYVYSGRVQLAGDPYTEIQPDKNCADRLVWVFPLRPDEPESAPKPTGLVFLDREDYDNRRCQAYYAFFRRRADYVGYRIQHIEHGPGTVVSFDGSIITISFDNNQTKSYNFDRSINGGYLQFPD